jgi:hypothetical protein
MEKVNSQNRKGSVFNEGTGSETKCAFALTFDRNEFKEI